MQILAVKNNLNSQTPTPNFKALRIRQSSPCIENFNHMREKEQSMLRPDLWTTNKFLLKYILGGKKCYPDGIVLTQKGSDIEKTINRNYFGNQAKSIDDDKAQILINTYNLQA
jgi:hypothetical protein